MGVSFEKLTRYIPFSQLLQDNYERLMKKTDIWAQDDPAVPADDAAIIATALMFWRSFTDWKEGKGTSNGDPLEVHE